MTTHLWASPPFTQTNNTDTAQSAQSLPRTNPGYGGLRPPWGQSLLRSYLAAHSFPPPPPAEDALRALALGWCTTRRSALRDDRAFHSSDDRAFPVRCPRTYRQPLRGPDTSPPPRAERAPHAGGGG